MGDSVPRCLLVCDFNSSNFAGYLANSEALPLIEPLAGSLGQVVPLLTDFHSSPWQAQPESAVVWTQPGSVSPEFARALENEPVFVEQLLAEVDAHCAAVTAAAGRLRAVLVPTWTLDPFTRGAGMADWREGGGLSLLLARMNLRLAENLGHLPNVFVLDAGRWIARAGAGAFPPQLWYQAKVPFGNAVFQEAVRDVKAALRGLHGMARKLVLVDLDDTLWGGIVGDAGWENLRLGGHDPDGEAYADFQRALKALTRRGIVLGIVSKNTEAVALEAVDRHPEMILRRADFAGWRINWRDKAANVAELAAELNLGLPSVVFIDDNPTERARVRETLPEVLVPEWPDSALLFKRALLALDCFDMPHRTEEDVRRAGLYAADRRRADARPLAGSLEDWLKNLEIKVAVEELGRQNLPRAAQLFNKTNQMNLSTRRFTETELAAWARQPGNRLWVFRVVDKHGDSGLTGLASLTVEGAQARIADFVLSCRVMGRKVEETMVHWLVAQARAAGASEVRADYLPTAKNKPCLEFWERSGFSRSAPQTFLWDIRADFPLPECVQLKF